MQTQVLSKPLTLTSKPGHIQTRVESFDYFNRFHRDTVESTHPHPNSNSSNSKKTQNLCLSFMFVCFIEFWVRLSLCFCFGGVWVKKTQICVSVCFIESSPSVCVSDSVCLCVSWVFGLGCLHSKHGSET